MHLAALKQLSQLFVYVAIGLSVGAMVAASLAYAAMREVERQERYRLADDAPTGGRRYAR